jgi:putative nucleotidyltransferase with HDIG domain
MNITKIIEIAKEHHDKEGYYYHISPVVRNALLLSEKLGADKEVVEIAAYLHDIGRSEKEMGEYKAENDHHIIGEQKTREILSGLGYDKGFIDKVAHCVLTHRGRKGPAPETLEAEIIANADAMAHFDAFLDLFRYFLAETATSFEEAVEVMSEKIQRNWNKKLTLPEAKEIVKEKYEAITLLLKSMKECMKQY